MAPFRDIPPLDAIRMHIDRSQVILAEPLLQSDSGGARTLKAMTFTNTTGMTPASCTKLCFDYNFGFAGVEYGQARKRIICGDNQTSSSRLYRSVLLRSVVRTSSPF
jgi:hypothetical protein